MTAWGIMLGQLGPKVRNKAIELHQAQGFGWANCSECGKEFMQRNARHFACGTDCGVARSKRIVKDKRTLAPSIFVAREAAGCEGSLKEEVK